MTLAQFAKYSDTQLRKVTGLRRCPKCGQRQRGRAVCETCKFSDFIDAHPIGLPRGR